MTPVGRGGLFGTGFYGPFRTFHEAFWTFHVSFRTFHVAFRTCNGVNLGISVIAYFLCTGSLFHGVALSGGVMELALERNTLGSLGVALSNRVGVRKLEALQRK